MGVKLHAENEVQEIHKNQYGNVTGVTLKDGTHIDAQMVVIGHGISPNTSFLKRTETDVKVDDKGAVICDPFLQTSDPNIFAAGDVASFPFWQTGKNTRVEHWINAQDTGSYAAFNMLGKFIPYGNTPIFWGRHYNKTIQFVGYCDKFDEVMIQGSPRDHKFIGYYFDGDRVCGASAQGKYKEILACFEAFNQNKMPSASDIKSGKANAETITQMLRESPSKGCVNCRCRKQANIDK